MTAEEAGAALTGAVRIVAGAGDAETGTSVASVVHGPLLTQTPAGPVRVVRM